MRYSVFQVQISSTDIEFFNAGVQTTLTTEWMNNRSFASEVPIWLIVDGHFRHVAEITTDADSDRVSVEADLANVFRIGNIGPGMGTGYLGSETITSRRRFHSISVGDIVMDPAGNLWHVRPVGWKQIGPAFGELSLALMEAIDPDLVNTAG